MASRDYREGFKDGWDACAENYAPAWDSREDRAREELRYDEAVEGGFFGPPKKPKKPKRKLTAWNRFIRDNKDKPRFKWKSTTAKHKKGQLNLKKMHVAYDKTPEGKAAKKRR